MFICGRSTITENRKIAEGVFSLRVRAEEIASSVRPGQFVSVACGFPGAFLRRPISVCSADGSIIRLVYETRGKGTRWLSQQAAGCELDIGGPQGNGFAIPDIGRVLLVGGGLGAAPLLFAASMPTFESSNMTVRSGGMPKCSIAIRKPWGSGLCLGISSAVSIRSKSFLSPNRSMIRSTFSPEAVVTRAM